MTEYINADVRIARTLNSYAVASPVMRTFTLLSAVWLAPILVVSMMVALFLSGEQEALRIGLVSSALAFLARFAVTECIYVIYKRERPSEREGITPLFINTRPSFPSGHATFFSALVMSFLLFLIPGSFVFSALVALMCLGRIAAGVHYPSDILAGFVIGVGTAWVGVPILAVYW